MRNSLLLQKREKASDLLSGLNFRHSAMPPKQDIHKSTPKINHH